MHCALLQQPAQYAVRLCNCAPNSHRVSRKYRSRDLQWEQEEYNAALAAKAKADAASHTPEGFLSFSRVADLNDMSVDLSESLRAPAKPLVPKRASPIDSALTGKKSTKRYADPPTPHQTHRWDRSRNYVKRGEVADAMALKARQLADPESTEAEMQAAENARFEQLRQEYNLWTSATIAVCFALIYFNYPRVRRRCCCSLYGAMHMFLLFLPKRFML